MQPIKIAAAALNQTPLDWDHNARNIRIAIDLAKEDSVGILCLPEMCITGYGCEDAFDSIGTARMAMRVLEEIREYSHGIIVSVGLPILIKSHLYNGAALLANGQILGIVCKQNLAGDGLHYEPRWFRPWPNNKTVEITAFGQRVPVGDLIFDCGGIRISFEICEDAWVMNRPGTELAQQGVDVILNPSASHFAFGKHGVRQRIVMDATESFHAAYVYANLSGNEAGRAIYDGDAMIAAEGKILASGNRLTYRDVELTTAVVDIGRTRQARADVGFALDDGFPSACPVVCTEFHFTGVPATTSDVANPSNAVSWESSTHLKSEEFLRAVCLGLFDYLRKSHSNGFVVSLSGGVDSTAVAVLAAMSLDLAVQDIGLEGVHRKLAYIDGIAECHTPRELTRRLLTCAYQATRNSTSVTREAAAQVAIELNAEFHCWDVEPIVAAYTSLVSDGIKRPLTWQQDDITLQNIQARRAVPVFGCWPI